MTQEKLDAFLPDTETLQLIKSQLVKAGVDSSSIPDYWLYAICAAFAKHVSSSEEGYNYISRLLNFHWQRGINTKEYILLDHAGNSIQEINYKEISVFTGCLVQGKPVHPSWVRVSDKTGYKCDDCGIRTYCVTEALDYRKDRIVSLCNTCLRFSEELRQRDLYRPGMCEECDDLCCTHNPKLEEHNR